MAGIKTPGLGLAALTLASLCLIVVSKPNNTHNSNNRNSSFINKEIIGGKEASIQAYPYLGHLEYLGYVCSATIISSVWLITAGICYKWHQEADDWIIVVGTGRLDYLGYRHRVIRWEQHPKYKWNAQDYDFALVCSSSSMIVSEFALPVSLPIQDSLTPAGSHALVAGWGQVYPEVHEMSNKIHAASLKTYSDAACKKLLGNQYTPRKLCAKQYRGGVSIASNDLGGPLVVNDLLYGISLPKLNDLYQDIYGVKQFARVSSVTDWIVKVTST